MPQQYDLDAVKINGLNWSLSLETRANTFNEVHLPLTNCVAGNILDIEVLIDNRPIQKWLTGQQINEHMYHYGRVDAVRTDEVNLIFTRRELEEAFRNLTAIGTMDVGSFVIKGRLAGGLTNPDVEAWAEVDAVTKLGTFTRIEQWDHSTASAGLKEVDDAPISGALVGLHYTPRATTVVDRFGIKYNRIMEKEGTPARFARMNADDGFNGIPNTTSIGFIGSRNPREAYEIGPRRFVQELTYANNADKAVDVVLETFSTFNG